MSPRDAHGELADALRGAARRVAPLWPLDRAVAVNPYLGLSELSFAEAATRLQRVAGACSTLPPAELLRRIDSGEVRDAELDAAIAEAASGLTRRQLIERLEAQVDSPSEIAVEAVTDVLGRVTGGAWSRSFVDDLGAWCASFFDEEYALWQPRRDGSPFICWRREASRDRRPEIRGAAGFRATIAALPSEPVEAAAWALARLEVPSRTRELYLHRLLIKLGGWAALASGRAWEARRDGQQDDSDLELLAIALCYEAALFESHSSSPELLHAWTEARQRWELLAATPVDLGVEARSVAQRAVERAAQRGLQERLRARPARAVTRATTRPSAQLVFCIDVRSEVLRRHLEATAPAVETLGFAGFFGLPFEFVPLGHARGLPHAPVLVRPTLRVIEGSTAPREAEQLTTRRAIASAWSAFKMGAVSCFSFVGPVGLGYLPKLLTDGFGLTQPAARAFREAGRGDRELRLVELEGGEEREASLEARIELAAAALAGMSLTGGFARLLVIAGHAASCTNNAHAAGLDCGACGGRPGDINARLAAALLNDPELRRGLAARGLVIPDDTFVLAGLHDTTTDEVELLNSHEVPASHRAELEALSEQLARAAVASREERARRGSTELTRDPFRRARDWAQLRPEWGLAGCAAFIAAPRSRTRGIDLGGRAFLHSYDWEQDDEFAVLETILTAPVVVASWISLQYYGSTVDPTLFGAGDKTLHNVVGGSLGVLEGAAGDLRQGLPWQSLDDGEGGQHEPLRLSVLVEAPPSAIDAILARHPEVAQLFDEGWLSLLALDERGRARRRRPRGLGWEEAQAAGASRELRLVGLPS